MASWVDPFLRSCQAVILDGGLATELERAAGKDLSRDHLWSARILADDPAAIVAVHHTYFAAGADIATTCSYQATVAGYVRAGYTRSQAEDLMRSSVRLACEARDEFWSAPRQPQHAHRVKPLVAFSCGPYGAMLADGSEFRGDYAEHLSLRELRDFHAERLALIEGLLGIDVLLFETIPCQKELEAICSLLTDVDLRLPAMVSMSCRDGQHTSHGEDFARDCLPLIYDVPAITAFGVNCTALPHIAPLLSRAHAELQSSGHIADKLLLCYPNSGEVYHDDTKVWSDGSTPLVAAQYGALAKTWCAAGATIIGGCCRTTPECIRAVRDNLSM